MSFAAAAWAISTDAVETAHQRLVLIILADCHNAESGRCDPSIAFVAERSMLSRRSVERCLAQLEERGLITRQERYEEGVGQTSNSYRLNIATPTPESRPPASHRRGPPSESRTPRVTVTQAPRQADAGPPVCVTHESGILNQEVNQEGEEDARARDPVVRVGEGWLITEAWKPSDAAIAQARMAGVRQSMIDDPLITSEFRLKYSEAPQRDQAFDKRWVRWLINETRNPRAPIPAARDPTLDPFEELRRRAAAEEAERVGARP